MTDSPDAASEKARKKVVADIGELKRVVESADVVYVGPDHNYAPDAPRLQAQLEDADTGQDTEDYE